MIIMALIVMTAVFLQKGAMQTKRCAFLEHWQIPEGWHFASEKAQLATWWFAGSLFLTMFQISLQVASYFEKLLRQLPRTNLPCEKTSLQELPASNIALHAGVVGFDLCAGRLGRLQVQRRKNCWMNDFLLKFILSTRLYIEKLVYGACKLYLRLSEMWLASLVWAGYMPSVCRYIKDIVYIGESFIEDDADDQQKGEILSRSRRR